MSHLDTIQNLFPVNASDLSNIPMAQHVNTD